MQIQRTRMSAGVLFLLTFLLAKRAYKTFEIQYVNVLWSRAAFNLAIQCSRHTRVHHTQNLQTHFIGFHNNSILQEDKLKFHIDFCSINLSFGRIFIFTNKWRLK